MAMTEFGVGYTPNRPTARNWRSVLFFSSDSRPTIEQVRNRVETLFWQGHPVTGLPMKEGDVKDALVQAEREIGPIGIGTI